MRSREQAGRGSQVESQSQPLAEFRFPARKDQLQLVRQFVRKTLDSHGCGTQYIDSTVLAVDEATTNVIQHAFGPDETGEIVLQITREGDSFVFRLVDTAAPIDPKSVRPRPLDAIRPGGLGVHIIREIMDTMEFEKTPEGSGNVLVMTRKVAQ